MKFVWNSFIKNRSIAKSTEGMICPTSASGRLRAHRAAQEYTCYSMPLLYKWAVTRLLLLDLLRNNAATYNIYDALIH